MDMPIIDRVFGMEGGFVLNFSDRTSSSPLLPFSRSHITNCCKGGGGAISGRGHELP